MLAEKTSSSRGQTFLSNHTARMHVCIAAFLYVCVSIHPPLKLPFHRFSQLFKKNKNKEEPSFSGIFVAKKHRAQYTQIEQVYLEMKCNQGHAGGGKHSSLVRRHQAGFHHSMEDCKQGRARPHFTTLWPVTLPGCQNPSQSVDSSTFAIFLHTC